MKTVNDRLQTMGLVLMVLLLSSCGQAATPAPVLESSPATQVPVLVTDPPVPTLSTGYQPVSAEVCQILQEQAGQSLGLTFEIESPAPFTDYSTSETGQGCTLTATTDGASISDPYDALTKLVNGFVGWTEDSVKYGAGGPTGAATGMTRDAGLMLISVGWEPSPDANCPTDQPISMCELTPAQKLYTITIEVAQK